MRFTYEIHVIKNETKLKKSNLYAKRENNVCLNLSLQYKTKYSLSLSQSSQYPHDLFSLQQFFLLYTTEEKYFLGKLLTIIIKGIYLMPALNFDRKNKDL